MTEVEVTIYETFNVTNTMKDKRKYLYYIIIYQIRVYIIKDQYLYHVSSLRFLT